MSASCFEDTRPGRHPRFVSALTVPLLCVAMLASVGVVSWLWRVWPW